jgi:hypothetical protein
MKNNKTCYNLNIGYDDKKSVEDAETTTFLGLQIDNNLNWKAHIQYIMPKLSSACFAMTVTSLMNTETLKLVYFAKYFTPKKNQNGSC